MDRLGSPTFLVLIGVASAGVAGCDQPRVTAAMAAEDTAFAEVQARGQEAMGVDQYTSTHVFDALPDGGRIELQRDGDDAAGVAQIRRHLQEIARAFGAGEFSAPAFVHMQDVPGTSVMAEKRDAITYTYRELPRGGELEIMTQDSVVLQAIHQFMAFQRQDHRAGGKEHGMHGGMNHEMDHAPHDHRGGDHAPPGSVHDGSHLE
jgi:hypothetical protein